MELRVREASVRQDGHLHLRGNELPQPLEHRVLGELSVAGRGRLHQRHPQQGGRAAMASDEACHERLLVVLLEVRPVQGNDGLGALGQYEGHPCAEKLPAVEAFIGEQPVHLLHRVLGADVLPPRPRHRLADGCLRQAGGLHRARRRVREGQDSFDVQLVLEHLRQERPHLHFVDGHLARQGGPSLCPGASTVARSDRTNAC